MAVICERFDSLGADGAPARLGIMGGTFDPIHVGHLACAEQVREALALDAVVFIPTGNPVFKRDQNVTPAEHRLAMCRLAVADNPCFDVSPLEIDRGGDTYTVDTLRTLRAHYLENVSLYFITGADALATIPKWRAADELARLATFVGATRPGFALTEEDRRRFAANPDLKAIPVEITALSVSSSALRERIAVGHSVRYLVPDAVIAYVEAQGLYRA